MCLLLPLDLLVPIFGISVTLSSGTSRAESCGSKRAVLAVFFLLSLSLFAIARYILMIGSGRRPTDEFEKEIKAELPHFRASSR